MFVFVEYLHSINWRILGPEYTLYRTILSSLLSVNPMARTMSGLWCCGLLRSGSRWRVMIDGVLSQCFSLCRLSSLCVCPSRSASNCDREASIWVCNLKSRTGVVPRSTLRISHRPPLACCSKSLNSAKVLLC